MTIDIKPGKDKWWVVAQLPFCLDSQTQVKSFGWQDSRAVVCSLTHCPSLPLVKLHFCETVRGYIEGHKTR